MCSQLLVPASANRPLPNIPSAVSAIRQQVDAEMVPFFSDQRTKLFARSIIWSNINFDAPLASFVKSGTNKLEAAMRAASMVLVSQSSLSQDPKFQTCARELTKSITADFNGRRDALSKEMVPVDIIFEGFGDKPPLQPRRYYWRREGNESYPVSDKRAAYKWVYVQSLNYGRGRIFSNNQPNIGGFVVCSGPDTSGAYVEVPWTWESRTALDWR
jgi:hypothetical protein